MGPLSMETKYAQVSSPKRCSKSNQMANLEINQKSFSKKKVPKSRVSHDRSKAGGNMMVLGDIGYNVHAYVLDGQENYHKDRIPVLFSNIQDRQIVLSFL